MATHETVPAFAAAAAVVASAAVMDQPYLWGFSGALVYGSGQLCAAIFSEASQDLSVKRRAWAQFLIAVFFGTAAAEAFGPDLATIAHNHVRPQAVWLSVGLSANGIWPVVERVIGQRIGAIISALFGARS